MKCDICGGNLSISHPVYKSIDGVVPWSDVVTDGMCISCFKMLGVLEYNLKLVRGNTIAPFRVVGHVVEYIRQAVKRSSGGHDEEYS